MKVIIVGAGISGLVLASALEKAGIDYVLLESRDTVAPQVGASIAMDPASLRVLEQLGAFAEIEAITSPIRRVKHIGPDGKLICPASFDAALHSTRFSYQTAFMDRQLILKATLNSIGQQQKKLLTGMRVAEVVQSESSVTVKCLNGSEFVGDLCIGCDGVNSKVRNEMWRMAEEAEPGFFAQEERTKMTAEYSCLFGISENVEEALTGDLDYAYDHGKSFLVISSKNKRVFWFFFQKLDKVYRRSDPDFPHYTKEDAERVGSENAWRPCHETMKFQTLWDKRMSCTLVAMEECLYDKWSWGRLAVVGDGSSKMTANSGSGSSSSSNESTFSTDSSRDSGGNCAIESAVAMANALQRLYDGGPLTTPVIQAAFENWQRKRQARINNTIKIAAMQCRLQSLSTWKDRFLLYWIIPNFSSLLMNLLCEGMLGAEILEYLPVPERSFQGTTPFNPTQGIGFEIDMRIRLFRTLPLFAFWYYLSSSTFATPKLIYTASQSSIYSAAWLQGLFVLGQTWLLYGIWLTESFRYGNKLTLVSIPTVFMLLASKFSLSTIAPWYFAVHYLTSDISRFASSDARLTDMAYTRTIIPVFAAVVFLPYILLSGGHSTGGEWFWMLAPLLVELLQRFLIKIGVSKSTILEDRLDPAKMRIDLKWIRLNIAILSTVSAGTCVAYLLKTFMASSSSILLSAWASTQSFVAVAISALYWAALILGDLKRAGMLDDISWVRIVCVGIVTLVSGGPATTVGLAWWAREEILASRRERNAFTKERYSGKTVREVREAMHGKDAHIGLSANDKSKQ